MSLPKLDETLGHVFDVDNIASATLAGDNLARCQSSWDAVLVGEGDAVSEATLEPSLPGSR